MKRWLWLISVGATDIQIPVWIQDESGAWSQLRRMEFEREGQRQVHEALLAMASVPGRVMLSAEDVRPFRAQRGNSVAVEHVEVDGEAVHSIRIVRPGAADRPPALRISASGDEIPNPYEATLTLLFPKIAPMVMAIQAASKGNDLSVIVLNTCRSSGVDAAREPVAAGPLAARFLAQELGLHWVEGGAAIPAMLAAGTCTWLDILQGGERLEDPEVEALVQGRMNTLLDAFDAQPGDRVVVSTSGGLPPLKPLIERIPAARLGTECVSVLDNPEGGQGRMPEFRPLAERWLDREMLRLHGVEALRSQDYAAAYGLAKRRSAGAAWARGVLACLAPMLDLPTSVSPDPCIEALEPYQLRAIRVETALAMSDVPMAIRHLSTFVESALWTLLRRGNALSACGFRVEEDSDGIFGEAELSGGLEQLFAPRRNRPGHYSPVSTTVFDQLPLWAADREADLALRDGLHQCRQVAMAYWQRQDGKTSIHDIRNRLSHGAGPAIELVDAEMRLVSSGLVAGAGGVFGTNFLDHAPVSRLLHLLQKNSGGSLVLQARQALQRALNAAARGGV